MQCHTKLGLVTAFAYFLSLLTSGLWIYFSWYMLLLKSQSVRGWSRSGLLFLEACSIAAATVAYASLFHVSIAKKPHHIFMKFAQSVVSYILFKVKKSSNKKRNYTTDIDSAEMLGGNSPQVSIISQSSQTTFKVTVLTFIWFCIVTSIHILIHYTIPEKHRLSQEIVMALCRCSLDACFWLVAASVVIWRALRVKYYGNICRGLRILAWISVVVFVIIGFYIIRVVQSVETIPHLRQGILGEPCDPCEAEGMQLNPILRSSWVLPALIPRLMYTYVGRKECHSSEWRSIGFIDETSEVLVVSSLCMDGNRPHIYLERPENNELNGRDDVILPEVVAGNKQYHKELEAKYGSTESAERLGVTVRRNHDSGMIAAVELTPSLLHPVTRTPKSDEERERRAHWPSDQVLEIPLGRSASYIVHCSEMVHEELFLFPLKEDIDVDSDAGNCGNEETKGKPCTGDDVAGKRGNTSTTKEAEPAGNVLFILFDAVSRQEVRRVLPRFSAWMQDFQRSQAKKKDGHIVIEPRGWTTLGYSTLGNLSPYLTGVTLDDVSSYYLMLADLMNRSIFNMAKDKYGSLMSTAMTSGYCIDFFSILLGNREPTSGSGGRLQGIDYYMYQPMCHLDYTGTHSNFAGPYSILKRCIDGRHVHEHLLDYTEYLLRRQLRQRAAAVACDATEMQSDKACSQKGKYFFHMAYFIEGHEGTHTTLALVDLALVRFMNLLVQLHFFDDPLNMLIFAGDHGNHMGPYYQFTNAGDFERTSPAMLYVVNPEVLRRVDLRKGRMSGEAMTNFLARMKRINTPLDLYMTLGDIMNVNATPHALFMETKLRPASMFDPRDGTLLHDCSDIYIRGKEEICSQDFCIAKNEGVAGG